MAIDRAREILTSTSEKTMDTMAVGILQVTRETTRMYFSY